MNILLSLLDILSVIVPILIAVAYVTLLERKVLASMQRRVGPDTVGVFGILQPFADALKLLVKEIVIPQVSQKTLFLMAPFITLSSALAGWAIIPFGTSLVVSDLELGWLFYLAVASLGIYGIIFGGWAANSVYALLGALRSTAHLISYELVLGGAALGALLLNGTFNLTSMSILYLETQSFVWSSICALPLFLIFLISAIAEVNRTPFDLVESESELVAGFMTEHGGFPFVLYFLAEYSNIVLISSIIAVLWLGGYQAPFLGGYLSGIVLGLKAFLSVFGIIWVRATLPRLRFDQLMSLGWSILLPVVFGLLVLMLSLMVIIGPVL